MNSQISIISGSTLGSAEYLAEYCEELLQDENKQTELFHGPNLSELTQNSHWLIVTSTHGAGDIPDNLVPLFNQIQINKVDLSNLTFSIIGLGNSDYDTFCFAVDKIELILHERGARRICPSLRIDILVIDDHNQEAKEWMLVLIEAIK